MPFNPRIVPRDDDAAPVKAESRLPDHLRLLAAQLTEESRLLTDAFPLRAADGQKVTAPQCLEMTDRGGRVRGSRRGAWLAVGSTVAAVLLIFSVIFLWGRRDDMAGKRFGGGLPIGGYKASPSVPADAAAESIARAAMRDRRANWSGVPITPVVWLGEASGPEMEAILDLWNDDPRQPTKVQF